AYEILWATSRGLGDVYKRQLNNNIVDDDQGIFVMCYYKRPDLFNLNYLGRGKWFDLFRCFRSNTLGAKMQALRIFLSRK
ncbi:WlaTC/HtrL family glycosyltransferase, partial [Escherichia coli]|uniref:WlaTC/HtrL family glycosyltransferase n=1 Tax=Escherichia coli TaxID=562 RepID=UPI0024BCF275